MAQEHVNSALASVPSSALVDFVAGTAGGIASLLASHPFDTVKTRLQAQHAAAPSPVASASAAARAGERAPLLPSSASAAAAAADHHYRGAVDAFRVIVREEKVVGLYKGVTSPLLGVALMNAAIFGTYSLCLRTLQHGASLDPTLHQTFLAGCGSGVLCAFITAPIDLIKIQEQMDFRRLAQPCAGGPLGRWVEAASAQWRHTCRTIASIWRAGSAGSGVGGIAMLYRGGGITALRDLGYGPYFFSYELVNRCLASRHGTGTHHGPAAAQLSALELAVSGALAGCIGWTATFPLDVVKTRMQAAPLASKPLPGVRDTVRAVYADGGARAFFRGLGTTLVRAVPANAALFVTYEATKSALTR